MVKQENVDMPASKMMASILGILKEENYIDNFKLIEDKKQGMLRVYLKYTGGKPAIRSITRISRPGLRVYVENTKVPRVLRGRGLAILSTSKGVMTDTRARDDKIGGEVIGYVW